MKKSRIRARPEKLAPNDPASPRARIIYAAFGAFLEHGFAKVSMLEIATRAKVSKRDLYAQFESKSALLIYCITSRAQNMGLPAELPAAVDRESLVATLATFGAIVLQELSVPEVQAAYRLAIAESWGAPEVAQTINQLGREATLAVLTKLMKQAQSQGLIDSAKPRELAGQFLALLCGDLLLQLLMRVAKQPSPGAGQRRAKAATEEFLMLHPSPVAPGLRDG